MRRFHLFTLLITALLSCLSGFAKGLDRRFQILPQPQSVEVLSEKGIDYTSFAYIQLVEGLDKEALPDLLKSLPNSPQKGKGIALALTEAGVPDSEEGYILEVRRDGATIKSRGLAGLFYGCQTLQQLMEDSRDCRTPIPQLKITDYPSIAYRAAPWDTKHHLDRMEYYYREIDRLARYKVNAVIWEIEDKLGYTRRPEIASPNAISKQEMQALCRYAKDHYVEISPLVQGLGHASFILKHHWELRENPASDWEFCPSNPDTYELQFDLYKDALEAMPYGKYLHIGGDEVSAIGIDERCEATGKTPFELQMYWLRKVCDFARENGRTPIFWDDMPLKYGGVMRFSNVSSEEEVAREWNSEKLDKSIDLFPKDCVYMRWLYGDATLAGHRRILQWYRDSGLTVMGATAASYGASPYLPRNDTNAGIIQGFSQLVAENNLAGILATAWDDGSPHLETVWRGYIAQAEFGWNPTGRTIEEFKVAHAKREFGFPPEDNTIQFVNKMEQLAYFFDGALVTSGRRNPAWGTTDFKLISLPDPEKPGEWSETYKERIAKAKEADQLYKDICQKIGKAHQTALRGHYTLDIYDSLNDLLHFPAMVILSLEKYDQASDYESRKQALKGIEEVCSYFETMRARLLDTYSKTRFMEQPEGYLPDQNRHNHLSAKTMNSDWVFYYELPMVKALSTLK